MIDPFGLVSPRKPFMEPGLLNKEHNAGSANGSYAEYIRHRSHSLRMSIGAAARAGVSHRAGSPGYDLPSSLRLPDDDPRGGLPGKAEVLSR